VIAALTHLILLARKTGNNNSKCSTFASSMFFTLLRVATSWKSPGFFLLSWKVLEFSYNFWKVTEPDSAVSAFEASSVTLLLVCRVGPKPGDLRVERNFRLVVCN